MEYQTPTIELIGSVGDLTLQSGSVPDVDGDDDN